MSEFVERQALTVKFPEARLVPKEGPIGDVSATAQKFFDRAVEPNQSHSVPLKKRKVGRLCRCAAAQ
jgi:hypothetical protein